ncbi:MAG TPA: cation-translocating P-type ATPase [Kiloniellales bacterium]|nr:cation-translocating P-type ATPase [Kiloniellales bacterium]
MLSTVTRGLKHPATRRMWITAGSAGLILLALFSNYVLEWNGGWIIFMVLAWLLAGQEIAIRAWQALRLRHLSIEMLVTLAAAGAIAIGEYWEAAAVTFLFMLGAWLEGRTMRHTRGALKALVEAAPSMATVLRNGEALEVPADSVERGEIVLVKAGQRIPVDGEVIEGAAAVNEAAISGEPIPAEKAPGARVHAGTLAENGLLQIRATGVGADTTLAKIIHRVEEAQEEKAPSQRMIESFARWYTPAIFGLGIAAFAFTGDIRLALTLLVVGCPGALVISTPVSIVAGIGRAARSGILIKGGQHLESAGRITALALDKTGTLTEGRPQLAEVVALEGASQKDVLRWAAIAEVGSDHPLGRPIIGAAQRAGPVPTPDQLEEIAGMGLLVRHEGGQIAAGNRRLMEKLGVAFSEAAEAALHGLLERGTTPVLVAHDGKLVGMLGLLDMARPSARAMIQGLHEAGIKRVVMLTGDQPQAARAIAAELGIDKVRGGLLPDDKLEHIRRLQKQGFKVAMIGDGINDAPALATADTSIAMGAAGSDLAIETADIALMTNDLGKVNEAIEIARATLRNMRQNLVIALATVAGLLIGVFAGEVHMAGGMLIHQLSVLLVILNGMRLMRRPGVTRQARPEVKDENASTTTGTPATQTVG